MKTSMIFGLISLIFFVLFFLTTIQEGQSRSKQYSADNKAREERMDRLRLNHLAANFEMGVAYGMLLNQRHPEKTAAEINILAVQNVKDMATQQGWFEFLEGK